MAGLPSKMYFTYILWSKQSKKFYIGFTADLIRRVDEHKRGCVYSTQRVINPELVFYEAFLSESDARRREGYFKTSKGKKALRIMLRDTLFE